MRSSLNARLAAAGVLPSAEPYQAWLRLRAAEGRRTTIIDLYELAARQRGLTASQLPRLERLQLARLAMPAIWPGFSTTDGTERPDVHLEVVACDPGWPARYAQWHRRLAGALGDTARRVAHVGSTSVPGLDAKPVIDIQVSVAELADEAQYVPQIGSLGVELRSRDVLHRFFRPQAGRPRDVHVHVCATGSGWEREHLLFRDYLRSHPAARDAYAAVKREAARVWADDRMAYTDAKTTVIMDILEAAESWAAVTSWAG